MQYSYKCQSCTMIEVINVPVVDRDKERLCDCGGDMKRMFSSPSSSKLIGLQNATKRDGVGSLVDIQGNICEPITRGNKKTKTG